MSKRVTPPRPNVLYVYASPENHTHITNLCKEFKAGPSSIINQMIDAHRSGKKVSFQVVVPQYVSKAKAWEQKHKDI